MKLLIKKSYPYLLIVLLSTLAMSPQISNHALIFGWDSIFHYNRFYDAMMQIKDGNFSPMISLYGWPHSGRGRIVNAVYGPGFAYFSGLLMLVTGSVFKFQVVMGILLSTLSGSLIYTFSRKCHVSVQLSFGFGILYMVSGNAMMWIVQNTMTGVASAFLPLVLFPIFDLFNDDGKRVYPLKLAIILGLLFQIHELTAVFAVLIYGISVCYFIYIKKAKHFLLYFKRWILASIIFILLTINFWIDLIEISTKNNILQPLKQTNAMHSTFFLLVKFGNFGFGTQLVISFIILTVLWFLLIFWSKKDFSSSFYCFSFITLFLIFLSMPILPWNWIFSHISSISIIQFPHRFVNVALVTFFASVIVCAAKLNIEHQRIFQIIVTIGAVILFGSQLSNLNQFSQKYVTATDTRQFIPSSVGNVSNFNATAVKEEWRKDNARSGIQTFYKGNYDYLPSNGDKNVSYRTTDENYFNSQSVQVSKGKLVVSGFQKKSGNLEVPIVKYANSVIKLNGKKLSNAETTINEVGRLKIYNVPSGTYTLSVSYKMYMWTFIGWILTGVTWMIVVIVLFTDVFKQFYNALIDARLILKRK